MAISTTSPYNNFHSLLSPPSHTQLPPPFSLSSSFSHLSLSTPSTPTLSRTLKTRDLLIPLIPSISPSLSDHHSLLQVVCPSLAFANTLAFKSGYNVQVIVGEHEPEEQLIGRFRREVLRAGVIQEAKRRRFFENKREERKRKTREAAIRYRKRRPQPKAKEQDKHGGSRKKEQDEKDDNWDFIDVDIPYN